MDETTYYETADEYTDFAPLAAADLREVEPGDEILLNDRKLPLRVQNRRETETGHAINCNANGYGYVVYVHEWEDQVGVVRVGNYRCGTETLDVDFIGVSPQDDETEDDDGEDEGDEETESADESADAEETTEDTDDDEDEREAHEWDDSRILELERRQIREARDDDVDRGEGVRTDGGQDDRDGGGCPECGDHYVVRNTETGALRCRHCGHSWGGDEDPPGQPPAEDLEGRRIRVCHYHGRLLEYVDERAFRVATEIGDVNQHIVVTEDYARDNLIDSQGGRQ